MKWFIFLTLTKNEGGFFMTKFTKFFIVLAVAMSIGVAQGAMDRQIFVIKTAGGTIPVRVEDTATVGDLK
jgi:hypothetical protein